MSRHDLLQHIFLFCPGFLRLYFKIAEAPLKETYESSWSIYLIRKQFWCGKSEWEPFMELIWEVFIGEVYKIFPFPEEREKFKQNPRGSKPGISSRDLIQKYGKKMNLQFLIHLKMIRLNIGEYLFNKSSFQELNQIYLVGRFPSLERWDSTRLCFKKWRAWLKIRKTLSSTDSFLCEIKTTASIYRWGYSDLIVEWWIFLRDMIKAILLILVGTRRGSLQERLATLGKRKASTQIISLTFKWARLSNGLHNRKCWWTCLLEGCSRKDGAKGEDKDLREEVLRRLKLRPKW